MKIISLYKKQAWYTHKSDCYCDRCFIHKCTKKGKKKKVSMDYFEYIQSSLWSSRKEEYYKKYKRQCKACGSYKDIHLHHLRYTEQGKEKDIDLVPLCESCHKELHQLYLIDRNLPQKTRVFIDMKQKQIRSMVNRWKSLDRQKVKHDIISVSNLPI